MSAFLNEMKDSLHSENERYNSVQNIRTTIFWDVTPCFLVKYIGTNDIYIYIYKFPVVAEHENDTVTNNGLLFTYYMTCK